MLSGSPTCRRTVSRREEGEAGPLDALLQRRLEAELAAVGAIVAELLALDRRAAHEMHAVEGLPRHPLVRPVVALPEAVLEDGAEARIPVSQRRLAPPLGQDLLVDLGQRDEEGAVLLLADAGVGTMGALDPLLHQPRQLADSLHGGIDAHHHRRDLVIDDGAIEEVLRLGAQEHGTEHVRIAQQRAHQVPGPVAGVEARELEHVGVGENWTVDARQRQPDFGREAGETGAWNGLPEPELVADDHFLAAAPHVVGDAVDGRPGEHAVTAARQLARAGVHAEQRIERAVHLEAAVEPFQDLGETRERPRERIEPAPEQRQQLAQGLVRQLRTELGERLPVVGGREGAESRRVAVALREPGADLPHAPPRSARNSGSDRPCAPRSLARAARRRGSAPRRGPRCRTGRRWRGCAPDRRWRAAARRSGNCAAPASPCRTGARWRPAPSGCRARSAPRSRHGRARRRSAASGRRRP